MIIVIMRYFSFEIRSKNTCNGKTWHCIKRNLRYVCICVCFSLDSIIKCSGWFDRECTPRKKTWCMCVCVCSSGEVGAMIIIFSFFLSRREKKREGEKKIECFKLFHWCIWRVGRPVCCNQQTNIIISVHEKKEKKLYLKLAFSSSYASSVYVFVWLCLVDDILISLNYDENME